jgi:putative ABC transport system substrate-binding protein
MPNRREFLSAAMASLLSVPPAAEGQHAWKVPRVGFLSAQSASDPQAQRALDVFRQSLRELGYMEGQSVAIDYRWAEGESPSGFPNLPLSWSV